MNPSVSKADLDAIEHEVYPDICNKLKMGFRQYLEKRDLRKIEIGHFEETLKTILGDEMEIILHNADGIALEDICNVGRAHPCYLLSYTDEGLIRMRYSWVHPGQSKQIHKKKAISSGPSSSFWTVRRLLVLIVFAMFIVLFKTKILTLLGLPPLPKVSQ